MPGITIVGGGVAGLTLAATLDPTRFDVTVIEQRPGASRVPTAFGMWPFALAALARIGLEGPVRERALRLQSGVLAAGCGDPDRPAVSLTRAAPHISLIPRPALLEVLEGAVPGAVRRPTDRVETAFGLPGDLVVGADGARSVVRSQVWGDEPRETGAIAIRGVLPAPADLPAGQMRELWGQGMLFGVGPNPGVGTNWYASATRLSCSPADALGWAREAFRHFPDPVADVLAQATPELTLVNPILESRRLRSLRRNRFVLIGDAAHAMSPNIGRGACEAIVDAIVLGEALNHAGIDDGIARYNRKRLLAPQLTRLAGMGLRRVGLSESAGRAIVRLASRLG